MSRGVTCVRWLNESGRLPVKLLLPSLRLESCNMRARVTNSRLGESSVTQHELVTQQRPESRLQSAWIKSQADMPTRKQAAEWCRVFITEQDVTRSVEGGSRQPSRQQHICMRSTCVQACMCALNGTCSQTDVALSARTLSRVPQESGTKPWKLL